METTEVELFCGGCGDKAAALDRHENGPCCQNLQTWRRGRDGLYNANAVAEPEDEQYPAPSCGNCGSTEWLLTTRQTVNTANDEEPAERTIFFCWENFDVVEAACASCGREAPHYVESA